MSVTVEIDGDAGGLHTAVAAAKSSMSGLNDAGGRVKGMLLPPAMIAGLGLMASGAAAAAGGMVALGAAAAPAVGAYAAVPAVMMAAKQAMFAVKLAAMGAAKAFEPITEALEKPTPAVKRLAEAVKPFTNDIVSLRNAAQRPILDALTKSIPKLSGLLPVLHEGMATTGKDIGHLVQAGAQMVSSPAWKADIQRQMKANSLTMTRLGSAGLNVADSLRHVLRASQPLVDWMGRGAVKLSQMALAATKAGRQSGEMAGFFEKTRAVMERFASIGGSLATALWNIGKAGAPLGNELLASIDKAAQRFEDFTKSASGKNTIAQFFADAKGPIYEMAKLAEDVVQAFGRISKSADIAPMVSQIRTQLLPVLESVIGGTTKAFGPTLVNFLTEAARLFGTFAGSSGPLVIFVQMLTGIAKGLNAVIQKVPGLQTVLTVIAGIAAVAKTVKFMGMVSGITAVMGMLSGFSAATALAKIRVIALNAASVAMRAVSLAASAAIGIVTGAQWLLNAALTANPIGLVVAALAALVAGLVYAYKHSETFRDIVNGVFGAVKTFVLGHINLIVGAVKAGWSAIETVTRTVWGAIEAVIINPLRTAAGGVRDAVGGVRDWLSGAWSSIKGAAESAWNAIKNAVLGPLRDARDAVGDIIGGLKGKIESGWSSVKNTISSVGSGILNALTEPFEQAWNAISSVVNRIKNAVSSIASLPGKALKAVIPGFAQGTAYAPAGLKLVGERGPELIYSPGGETIVPASRTASILRQVGGGDGGQTVNFYGPIGSQRAARVAAADVAYRLRFGA